MSISNVNYNGSHMSVDLEFAKIAIREREDRVDDEPSESPKMDVDSGENTTSDSNIDGDVVWMIRPHSMLPKPEVSLGVTCSSSAPLQRSVHGAAKECPPIHRSLLSPEKTSAMLRGGHS
ncbi:hypothetical protein RHGRI_026433 [Rhododendron griersonianum]|uniref:Uncharacterized protein n=1 Tax=Rhododendron griersonianum TaxID=479676 RepID=A0AAV6IX81_9ERIC|nr:hypothetical protein RHGRI_026433 [Rhododendron griersonianum]